MVCMYVSDKQLSAVCGVGGQDPKDVARSFRALHS